MENTVNAAVFIQRRKKMKTETLSDMIFKFVDEKREYINVEHVKEFIKRLKEEMINFMHTNRVHAIIDKLAGKELI